MFFRRFTRKKEQKPQDLDDAELIRRYQDPESDPRWNLEWVGALFERYIHLVYGVCLKYLRNEEDAKDAVMQVFEKLGVELKRNADGDKRILNFKSWLHTLVKNYCLMWLRSRQSKAGREAAAFSLDEMLREWPAHGEESGSVESANGWHPMEEESSENTLALVEKGLQGLPTEQRTCLQLFYLEEKCYKDIAQITGFELNKVKSYIQNGKRNLKIYVEKNHE